MRTRVIQPRLVRGARHRHRDFELRRVLSPIFQQTSAEPETVPWTAEAAPQPPLFHSVRSPAWEGVDPNFEEIMQETPHY